MKTIITYKPHLTARIVTSLILQIVLVVLIRQPHQDSMIFNLGILVISVLAMAPVTFVPRWLPFRSVLILRLLGMFPLFVILATMLHLLGWSGWFRWLVVFLSGWW